jgi:hypothetical protein
MTTSSVPFTENDFDNLELVRQVLLRRLKNDSMWNQFDYTWDMNTANYVRFEPDRVRRRFVVLANEVMWELIIQGVITPGLNESNPTLPFFRLTAYGKKVLEAERFIAHDPVGYLDEIRAVATTSVGGASLPYLEEALRCFTSGCHLASVLLLGVAAEAVFLSLCARVEQALTDKTEQARLKKLQQVKPKHHWLIQKIESLPSQQRRSHLPESLDVTLTSLYDLIRRQRNELGHPRAHLPSIDRELAFTYFKLFPTFIADAEALAAYCSQHGL